MDALVGEIKWLHFGFCDDGWPNEGLLRPKLAWRANAQSGVTRKNN